MFQDGSTMEDVYFERQSLMRCAVHTLNNILQQHAYTASDLDDLAYELTPFSILASNPHKSFFGVGNYDG